MYAGQYPDRNIVHKDVFEISKLNSGRQIIANAKPIIPKRRITVETLVSTQPIQFHS